MHTLTKFGVNDQRQFNHRFLRQGCWTRCTTCSQKQGVASDGITESATPSKTTSADNVCTVCAERWPGKEIHVDCHICCVCVKEYPRADWTVDIMKKHRAQKKKERVCRVCIDKGCSAKDVKLYHCDGCGLDLGHVRFEKNNLYNKARTGRRHAELLCLECQSKIPCDACKTRYPKKSWPVKMLKDQKHRGTQLCAAVARSKGARQMIQALRTKNITKFQGFR